MLKQKYLQLYLNYFQDALSNTMIIYFFIITILLVVLSFSYRSFGIFNLSLWEENQLQFQEGLLIR
jgi:hypothetical protein